MPVDFLSAAQIAGHGRYGEARSARQLERFFHFDDLDRERIAGRRGDHNRLGFAVQLATVRLLGTFLAHPADVPAVVAATVARELAITDPGCLAEYARREQTHREHAGEIQCVYGYRDFSQRTAQAELTTWLQARAWITAERPSVLFDLATARLRDVRDIGVGQIVVDVPAGRERALARYGLVAKAQALRRMSAERRDATMLAALWQLELDAADDALVLLDQVVDQLLSQAAREHKHERLKALPELDRAARRWRAAVLVLLDPPRGGIDALWAAIGARVSRDEPHAASEAIGRLTPPELDSGGQDAAFRAELLRRYPSLRRFLPALLEVVPFEATGAGKPILAALNALREIEGRPGRVTAASVPLDVVGGRGSGSCSPTRSWAIASLTAAPTASVSSKRSRAPSIVAMSSSRGPGDTRTRARSCSAGRRGRRPGPRSARASTTARTPSTGFPDLGAATFQRPGDPPALLVESVQSVTNHLEAAGWDAAAAEPVATLAALPWVRVTAPDGAYLTSSRTEPHRLAAAYVRDGRIEGVKGTEWLVQRLGLVKDRPLPWASIYTALFELDPLTLLHGVFFSEKGIHGNPKVRRAVTALVEAEDVAPVVSGGLKRDDVAFTAGEGRNAEAGYGFVPFGRTEFTAREIKLRVVVDLEQIRGYGLGDERAALLEDIALWQIATLVSRPLRLRTMCDLDVVATTVARPAGFALREPDELAERIASSAVEFEHAGARSAVFGAL